MDEAHPVLLILPERSDWAEANALPTDSDNLFQRIIRNPHIESARPRERQCTEMLCAVLRNTKELRLHLLRWLAGLADQSIADLHELDVVIDTEQPIGGKRDDLRIEGWSSKDDVVEPALLWTVEVKVGAGFHYGSPLHLGDSADDEPPSEELPEEEKTEDEELVNQLLNYDRWLAQQPATHCAGFVLAIQDKTAQLPVDLKCCWKCLTWTDLGRKVKSFLDEKNIPPNESLLARHMLGFIRKHLWSATGMGEEQITFDDIAFLRALPRIGLACEKKIHRLVAQLIPILEESGMGCGKINHQQVIFRDLCRSVIWQPLFDVELSPYPHLYMGVWEDNLSIWLETSPAHADKPKILRAIEPVAGRLRQRNPNWHITAIGGDWMDKEEWWDMELASPLSALLIVADQDAAFKEFFIKALEDIKSCGVVPAIRRVLKRERNAR